MNNTIETNNINFQGYKLNKSQRAYIRERASSILQQDIKDIIQLSKHASDNKLNFLDALTDNYNCFNFYRSLEKTENPLLVNKIFTIIKKPKNIHYYIAERFADSFASMLRIFELAKNSSKKLHFVKNVSKDIFDRKNDQAKILIPQLLESKYINKYINNYKNIKPYFILNKKNKDAVKNLDEMFANKSFDAKLYATKLKELNIKNSYPFEDTKILNKQTFYENYNKFTKDFLDNLISKAYISNRAVTEGADEPLLKMLKTLNKQNYKMRNKIIDGFTYDLVNENKTNLKDKLNQLTILFEAADNNKNIKKFINKTFPKVAKNLSIKEMNEIISNIPAKKLNIFSSNVHNIIKQTRSHERIDALNKHIENPFFKTKNSRISNGFFTKLYIGTKNIFNILRDRLSSKDLSTAIQNGTKTTTSEFKPTIIPDTTKIVEQKNAKPLQISKPEKDIANSETKQSAKQNNKQLVIDSVLSLIQPKLGAKTLSKQSDIYAQYATKIRLSVLPEIFASITETRKVDRAVGKRKINSSNKDALDLYLKINGSNRKFINYMLKKRNVDNTRMFEVKDILNAVNAAEAKIAKEKQLNPNYKARDARAYYNHLFDAKVEQYGKVKRQKTFNTNA